MIPNATHASEHTTLAFVKRNPHIDASLIHQIGQGHPDALESLYLQTERILYAYLLSLTKDHDLSLDLLQETYLKVLGSAHLYMHKGKPLAWLFSIAKNLFYDEMRKQKHLINIGDEAILDKMNVPYEMHPENRLVLEAALKILNEDERSIILLFSVTGLKHREIAETLGLNISTVISKYHRGLKKLRQSIEEV